MPPTEPRPEPPVLEGELDIVLALSGLRAAADDTDLAGRASCLLAGEEGA